VRFIKTIGLLALFILAVDIFQFAGKGPQVSPKPGSSAPSLMGKLFKGGTEVKLTGLRGKVVLVNFWATWCYPCRLEIPSFVRIYKDYKDKGLEILGVNVDEDGEKVVANFRVRPKSC